MTNTSPLQRIWHGISFGAFLAAMVAFVLIGPVAGSILLAVAIVLSVATCLEHLLPTPLRERWNALIQICDQIGKLGILWAIGSFLITQEAARNRDAWATLYQCAGNGGEGGRIGALQHLHGEGLSLFGLDLTHAYLIGLDLPHADLRNSNFADAILNEANLEHARLRECVFSKAQMRRAVLSKANLGKVKLLETDLRSACLCGARLPDADLNSALMGKARLYGTDLSTSQNLTLAQLETAWLDRKTMLPEALAGNLEALVAGQRGRDREGLEPCAHFEDADL